MWYIYLGKIQIVQGVAVEDRIDGGIKNKISNEKFFQITFIPYKEEVTRYIPKGRMEWVIDSIIIIIKSSVFEVLNIFRGDAVGFPKSNTAQV